MSAPLFDQLPDTLVASVQRHWDKFLDSASSEQVALLEQQDSDFWQQLSRCWAGSDFVAGLCAKHPDWLINSLESLSQSYSADHYQNSLNTKLAKVETEAELHKLLRQFRNQSMLRIIWRDLNRLADMQETTADLSRMADACVDGALSWLYDWACTDWGTPYSRAGVQQRLVVIGMGKLGAGELNLSSDIDLMFTFAEDGETRDGRRTFDNQVFFNRLGQKLIQALDNTNADGFVFRVDMRLRPYGRSGILCPSFAAMEEYYEDQGRDWERYALIKARIIAGDKAAGQRLMQNLRPFVYRRYLDYSAFDALRSMKSMIQKEVRLKNMESNVKLGSGGIREVEFIAQVFQLIRGGQDVRLQQRELAKILPLLPEAIGFPQEAVDELWSAYQFLRNSEHAIQAVNDKQTQVLPIDEPERLRLAYSMGFDDWDAFFTALSEHRAIVSQHFADTIAPAPELGSFCEVSDNREWQALWLTQIDDEAAIQFCQQQGFTDAEQAFAQIKRLRDGRRVSQMQEVSHDRLDQVMPILLDTLASTDNPDATLPRILSWVEAVLRRSTYLTMLLENPSALAQLVKLCSQSPWIAEQLTRQPVLMEELTDTETLYSPPAKGELDNELRQELLRIPEDDTEQLMNALRNFKHGHVLRVAAADITGVLPLMKVSDYLTHLAECILEVTLNIAWRGLTAKHGFPQKKDGTPCDPDFIIVGYGKSGGIELSYGSDLDLVFIHDADTSLPTDGEKSIDCQVFFTRLGQRIIHLLNTATTSGQLYEVDMRLRPSGASGLLVSSLTAFESYQTKEAWTWEHQALVRARTLAGDRDLRDAFIKVRESTLRRTRDIEELRAEVVKMRQKMRIHLGTKPGAKTAEDKAEVEFNLKQDAGGIVDIEFIVQFAVLAYSHQHPELVAYTDNIRVLECIESLGLLPSDDTNQLREAYIALRTASHRQALLKLPSVMATTELDQHRQNVTRIWQTWVESPAA